MGWAVQMDSDMRAHDATTEMAAVLIHSILEEGAWIVATEHASGRTIEFFGTARRLRLPTIRRRLVGVDIEDL